MKKVKYLAMVFAALSFAACTDDVVDAQQDGSANGSGAGTPAYLTISFAANEGSSTRANSGDTHGTEEDSGHQSAGVTGESTITNALVVVSPQSTGPDAAGFAKLYTVSGTADEDKIVDDQTGSYSTVKPIEINTGSYNVIVVLNPASALTSAYTTGGEEDETLTKGITTTATVREIYDKILNDAYTYTAASTTDNYENAAASIGMTGGVGNKPYFMMANKAAATVEVMAAHTSENPAQVTVTVERTLSKITFRPTTPEETGVQNVYPVEVNLGREPAITVTGAIAKEQPDTGYDFVTLNQATDAVGNTVYALYEDGAFQGVYKQDSKYNGEDIPEGVTGDVYIYTALTAKLVADYNAATAEEKAGYYAVADANANNTLDTDEKDDITLTPNTSGSTNTENWYVRLEGYSLINLAKSVNYVRHTVAQGGVQAPFGTLSNSTYLWTPYFEAKNALDATTDFTANINDNWYYNPLSAVSTESKTLSVGSDGNIDWVETNGYFKAFGSTDGGDATGNTAPEPTDLGILLGYCFENSTDATHQVHGLSTGISFVARIFKDKACTQPIEKLYLYADHNYTTLAAINQAYGGTIPAIAALAEKEADGTAITKEELAKAGVTEYNGNLCYYYTTEIKHFDNSKDAERGVNEFIIMRNNIYSLAVSTINEIGAPFVDPTPNTPNESEEAALDITVKLTPWIVRYNDIEF